MPAGFVSRRSEKTFEMFDLVETIKPLGFSHNFTSATCVFGTEIAQQSYSCGDNCTPQ
jgi:hypothetical protein